MKDIKNNKKDIIGEMYNIKLPKDDAGDLIAVRQELKSYGYDPADIKMDHYLLFDKLTGELQDGVWATLTKEQVEKYKVQMPDVVVLRKGKLLFVVEVDGAAHWTKPGLKRTRKRDETYSAAGINYIVLDKADLKLMGWEWQEYLKKQHDSISFS